jgi:hypothetical protein
MVRGEQEVMIEREMIQFHLLEQTGATNPFLGMMTFLQAINNGKYVFEYSNLMARALDQTDPTTAAQLRAIVQSNGMQTVSLEERFKYLIPYNKYLFFLGRRIGYSTFKRSFSSL